MQVLGISKFNYYYYYFFIFDNWEEIPVYLFLGEEFSIPRLVYFLKNSIERFLHGGNCIFWITDNFQSYNVNNFCFFIDFYIAPVFIIALGFMLCFFPCSLTFCIFLLLSAYLFQMWVLELLHLLWILVSFLFSHCYGLVYCDCQLWLLTVLFQYSVHVLFSATASGL